MDKENENKALFFLKKDDSGSIPSTQYPAFHYPAFSLKKLFLLCVEPVFLWKNQGIRNLDIGYPSAAGTLGALRLLENMEGTGFG